MTEFNTGTKTLMIILADGFNISQRKRDLTEEQLFAITIAEIKNHKVGFSLKEIEDTLEEIKGNHEQFIKNPQRLANANQTIDRFMLAYLAAIGKTTN